jgi:hypothetical protein
VKSVILILIYSQLPHRLGEHRVHSAREAHPPGSSRITYDEIFISIGAEPAPLGWDYIAVPLVSFHCQLFPWMPVAPPPDTERRDFPYPFNPPDRGPW